MNMRQSRKSLLIQILCIIAVMAAAVLVRLPSASVSNASPGAVDAYTRDDGRRYMSELDSYYHVRLVDNQLTWGRFGKTALDDGTAWDTQSFWPEGRSAEYQPGIVWLTIGAWKAVNAVFSTDLYTVEWALAPVMSMLAALVAYIIGRRMSGTAGGFVAGILVACSSAFTIRTTFGRFDTDMFVILMDLLLILFMTEALRAEKRRGRILHSAGFVLSAFLYSLCWTPESALLFTLLMFFGGLLYTAALAFPSDGPSGFQGRIVYFVRLPQLHTLLICTAVSVLALILRHGTALFSSFSGMLSQTASLRTSGVLPNAYAMIAELQTADLVPDTFLQWFSGYVPGRNLTLLNGVGGLAVALLSIAALGWLLYHAQTRFRIGKQAPREGILAADHCRLYACVMGFLFVIGLYGTGKGLRFIEHFAVPVGLLTGSLIGWFAAGLDQDILKVRLGKAAMCVVLCIAAVIPTVSGSLAACRNTRPSVSDASAAGMRWIRENAEDPDAVVASWWDYGYFYESESGHPCLWDGYWESGAAGNIRAILVSKALTADSRALSRSILKMLSGSGNKGIDLLMAHTDAGTAFEILWEALPLDRQAAESFLRERLGMTADEAAEAEALLHPEDRETYLVLSQSMLMEMGWFEYYANWDFTGAASPLVSSMYNYTPDGYSITDSEKGKDYFEKIRSKETLWRLYFDGDGGDCFDLYFSADDGVQQVYIWKVK